jgi:hypothetical protein
LLVWLIIGLLAPIWLAGSFMASLPNNLARDWKRWSIFVVSFGHPIRPNGDGHMRQFDPQRADATGRQRQRHGDPATLQNWIQGAIGTGTYRQQT